MRDGRVEHAMQGELTAEREAHGWAAEAHVAAEAAHEAEDGAYGDRRQEEGGPENEEIAGAVEGEADLR